jgi:hypothetical protein
MARPVFIVAHLMSEYRKEVEFLRQCIVYEESAERQKLEQEIAYIQRHARGVQRASWLMAFLTALSVAGLGCPAILLESFPYNAPRFIVNLVCALGMASLISLLLCARLGLVYRKKMDQRKEACRQMVTKLLESRLSKPLTQPLQDMPDSCVGDRNNGAAQIGAKACRCHAGVARSVNGIMI